MIDGSFALHISRETVPEFDTANIDFLNRYDFWPSPPASPSRLLHNSLYFHIFKNKVSLESFYSVVFTFE